MATPFPEIEGLTFREFLPFDKYLLEKFDQTCKQSDGDQHVSQIPSDVTKAAIRDKKNAVIVADKQKIVATGWILPGMPRRGEQRIVLGAQVLPDYRDYGIGRALLGWAETRIQEIAKRDAMLILVLVNEAINEGANALYLDYGYEPVVTEDLYVRELKGEVPIPSTPLGLEEVQWSTLTSHRFFEAYREGFRDRLGNTEPDREDWINSYQIDEDFRADLSTLLLDGERPVAMVTCERIKNTGMIAQIAVIPDYRRKMVGRELIEQCCGRFAAESCTDVQTYISVNNVPSLQLFQSAGFQRRLTRARYEKKVMLS